MPAECLLETARQLQADWQDNFEMTYYDHIAKQWHAATGFKSGPFKELVLNDVLLGKLPGLEQCAILELGAGNGYFLPLVLRHFSGQVPASLTITDQSARQLEIAQGHVKLRDAHYQLLDVGRAFPFADGTRDLVTATMLFNEVVPRVFKNALQECHRVLSHRGLLLITVAHPDFIDSLWKRDLLKRSGDGTLTMPGSGTLRLPVVRRSLADYRRGLRDAGFAYKEDEVHSTPEVLKNKGGLRNAWKVPIALVYACRKPR